MSDKENNSDNTNAENEPRPCGGAQDKRPCGCEHESDRRTAQFLARQIGLVQDRFFDLVNDMRTFEHYSQIEDAGWCLKVMQKMKLKYRKFAETGQWEEDD